MHILSRQIYLLIKKQSRHLGWHKFQQGKLVEQDENHYTAVKYNLTFQTMIPYNSRVNFPYVIHAYNVI